MRIQTVLSITLALATGALAQPYAAWGKYKEITVNTTNSGGGANVANTVNNIPVLIRLTASNAADIFAGEHAALPEGADIRISNGDGSAAVPFEIERWDAGNQVAEIWALASSVAGNDSAATFRIYWKKADAVSASGTNVFTADNGYVGAWHMGNAAEGEARPASVTGAPPAHIRNGALPPVEGVIGLADSVGYNGTGQNRGDNATGGRYVDIGRDEASNNLNYAGFSDFSGGFAYSLWARESALASYVRLMILAADETEAFVGPSARMLFMACQISNCQGNVAQQRNIAVRWPPSNASWNGTATPAYNQGEWNHFFFSKPSGTSPISIYVNGTLYGTTGDLEAPANVTRNVLIVGRSGDQWQYMTGRVDNLTLSNTPRSADYVKLSFETQKPGATAVVLGETQSGDGTAVRDARSVSRYGFTAKTSGAGALFRIAEAATASVTVSDVRGQVVWKGSFANGARELAWNGENASSGLYVARLTVLDKQGRASSVDRRFTLAR